MDGAVPRSGGRGREGRGHRSRFDDLWRRRDVVMIIHGSPMSFKWTAFLVNPRAKLWRSKQRYRVGSGFRVRVVMFA